MELHHSPKSESIRSTRILADSEQSLERILYVWAIRHPASGYVQGINDLVCPFFQVFLNAYIGEQLPELRDHHAESRFQNPILSSST